MTHVVITSNMDSISHVCVCMQTPALVCGCYVKYVPPASYYFRKRSAPVVTYLESARRALFNGVIFIEVRDGWNLIILCSKTLQIKTPRRIRAENRCPYVPLFFLKK